MANIELKSTSSARVQKILRVMRKAERSNPWDLPVMASPPTVSAVSTTQPIATLPVAVVVATTPGVINHFGGVSTANVTPALVLATTTRNDGSTFTYSGVVETDTDAPIIGFGFNAPTIAFLIEVDGQFVSYTPTTGTGGGTLYFTLDFGSRKVRRIRIHCSSAIRFVYRTQADKAWAPPTDDVVRFIVMGDSFVAGTGASQLVLSLPNIMGAVLGFRDTRACGIGGTGYVNPGSGTAWKSRDHITDITNNSPDVVVFEHGLNDASLAAQVQAEALLNYQLVRAALPNTPIVVLGAQSGNTGPSANVIACEAAILSAVTQFADPLCKFAPVSNNLGGAWVNGTGRTGAPTGVGNADIYQGGTDGTDGTHPNDLGHAYLARRSAVAVRQAIQSMAV